MSVSIELLDTAKRLLGGVSDYRLAKIIGVSQPTISKYRNDGLPLSAERVIQICELTHLDAAEWMLRLYAERAKCDKEKAICDELRTRRAA